MKIPSSVIELAIEEAEKSTVKKAKMGSVIFTKQGKILGYGHNLYGGNNKHKQYYTKFRRMYWSYHAECQAIKHVHPQDKQLLNGACIYTYRKNGLLAAPCKDCWDVIIRNGITEIYYSMGNINETIQK